MRGKFAFVPFLLFPLLVIVFEYTAVSASLAYARYAVEPGRPVVAILGGLIRIGDTVSYKGVPALVIVLHVAAAAMIVLYFVFYGLRCLAAKEERQAAHD